MSCSRVLLTSRGVSILTPDGEILDTDMAGLRNHEADGVVVCIHTPDLLHRMALDAAPWQAQTLDLLELFAFAHPGHNITPTLGGLTAHLGLDNEGITTMPVVEAALLAHIKARMDDDPVIIALAEMMAWGGWGWSGAVLHSLGREPGRDHSPSKGFVQPVLDAIEAIPRWQHTGPADASVDEVGLESQEVLQELEAIAPQTREAQLRYGAFMAQLFQPPEDPDEPRMLLAQAGTGTGKTLGYLVPALLWSQRAGAQVWISTFTRNLQHQILKEARQHWPEMPSQRIVLRKGRENYLCLRNLHDAVAAAYPDSSLGLGFILRWLLESDSRNLDGDLTGPNFPSWQPEMLSLIPRLHDRRGECTYRACHHFRRCCIERVARRASKADVVITNHALTLQSLSRMEAPKPGQECPPHAPALPGRVIFDEGHHLYQAADSFFAVDFSLHSSHSLRWWCQRGTGNRHRRLAIDSEILAHSPPCAEALDDVTQAIQILPDDHWQTRLTESDPVLTNPCEVFFHTLARLIRERTLEERHGYDLEIRPTPLPAELARLLHLVVQGLQRIDTTAKALYQALQRTAGDAQDLPTDRVRYEAICRRLEERCLGPVEGWLAMLTDLENPQVLHRALLLRAHGQSTNVVLRRNAIDPTRAFMELMAASSKGFAVTSATLTDRQVDEAQDDEEQDVPTDEASKLPKPWLWADIRTGAHHATGEPARLNQPSPFDYHEQARVLLVQDVDVFNLKALAAAYQALFLASRGGAIGLFTAIVRMRAVYEAIRLPLSHHRLPLYAQHTGPASVSALLDVFQADPHSCLLGTDAVRDGVDIPGDSLRMIVLERTPWAVPRLLHTTRRSQSPLTPQAWDQAHARARLRQAFGRLIRTHADRGVFVLLDRRVPSALCDAFPHMPHTRKCSLSQACQAVDSFLNPPTPANP